MPVKSVEQIERDIDAALRRCRSLAAEGLWRRMRFLMEHESDRRPYARLNGTPVKTPGQLSDATGCPGVKVSRALPRLEGQGLVKPSAEGYYSPHVQRIVELRTMSANRKRKCLERKEKSTQRKGRALRNALQGVTSHQGNALVTPSVPSPLPSPPITPSSIPPTPERSDLSTNPTAGGGRAGVGNTLQARVMADVWEPMWAAAHHGAGYAPARVDFVKLAEILGRLGCRRDEAHAVERFRKIAATALAQPEEFGWQGHRLPVVEKNLSWLISETAKAEKGVVNGNGHRKPAAASRAGECEQAVVIRNVS